MNRPLQQHDRGFTITELLVVVAIIALLGALILVSFKGVFTGAQQTRSANALRDIIRGYLNYSTDNKQRLMPGYIAPGDLAVNGGPVDVQAFSFNDSQLNDVDTGSYVWRLLPYINNDLKALNMDYGSKRFDSIIDNEVTVGGTFGQGTRVAGASYGAGFVPSYGLNSIYLGGDSVHGPAADAAPWNTLGNPPIAATRISDVRNSAGVIVFAPTRMVNPPADFATMSMQDDISLGSAELRPPYVNGIAQWTHIGADRTANAIGGFGNFGGVPIARRGNFLVPNVRLDGSTSLDEINQLGPPDGDEGDPDVQRLFMRLWDPFATGIINNPN